MDKIIKYIKPFGYIVAVATALYMANILHNFDMHALQFKNPFLSVVYILFFGVWAALFVIIGAYNWKLILEFVNEAPLPAKEVFRVYLKSNIAKYLPGNVMHYAGRNYLGNKLGWGNTQLAFSSLLEYIFGFGITGFIVILFVFVGLITIPPQISLKINFDTIFGYSVVFASGAVVFVFSAYAYRYLANKEEFRVTTDKLWNKAIQFCTFRFVVLFAKMIIISLLCFVMNSLFYFYLCELILDFHIRPNDFFNANAALSIANYTGILTPGVPGGIGVKESVSIALISAYGYPKEILVMSILVFRITCVLGDLLPYAIVVLYRYKSNEEPLRRE